MEKRDMKNEIANVDKLLEERGIVLPKNWGDQIANTISIYQQNGQLTFPKNYNVGNAIMGAYLTIAQDSKLKVCSKESIVQSVIDMTVLGLNVQKKQCYFIPMGNKCTLITSYFGKQSAVKRINGIIDVRSDVIYKDTGYELIPDEYGNDTIKITKSCPLELRKNENIIGAWAKVIMNEEIWGAKEYTAIMTREDIQNAHNMGNAKGNSKAHKDFFNEMAKKSAINRCVKNFINSRADEDILIESFNRTVENDYSQEREQQRVYEKKVVNANDVFNADYEEKTTSEKINKEEKVTAEFVEEKQENNDIDNLNIEF
jgi:recombination protein RecT